MIGYGIFAFDRSQNILYTFRREKNVQKSLITGVNILTGNIDRACTLTARAVEGLEWLGSPFALLAITKAVPGGVWTVMTLTVSGNVQTAECTLGAVSTTSPAVTYITQFDLPDTVMPIHGMIAFDSFNVAAVIMTRPLPVTPPTTPPPTVPYKASIKVYSLLGTGIGAQLGLDVDFNPFAVSAAALLAAPQFPSNIDYLPVIPSGPGLDVSPNWTPGGGALLVSFVDQADKMTKIWLGRFTGTTFVTLGVQPITAEQTRMLISGAVAGSGLDNAEIILSSRYTPPLVGTITDTRILTKPIYWEAVKAAVTYQSTIYFNGNPLAFFVADPPRFDTISRCVGFSTNANEEIEISMSSGMKLITDATNPSTNPNLLLQCRWRSLATPAPLLPAPLVMTRRDGNRATCVVPQLSGTVRAGVLKLSISNDAFHFGPDERDFPVYNPTTNLTVDSAPAIRNYDTYYYLDFGTLATITIAWSSTDPGTSFTPPSLAFAGEARKSGGLVMRFGRKGTNTITGTVTACPPSGAAPVTVIPSFTIVLEVKEFVGLDLPPSIIVTSPGSALAPLTVFVYLGGLTTATRVPYVVTFTPSITGGPGLGNIPNFAPLVFNGESAKSFQLVGTGLGALELTLTPTGPDAASFAIMKFYTTVVTVNTTLVPDNVRLNTPTLITVQLDRKVTMVFSVTLADVAGKITDSTGNSANPSLTFVNSDQATFTLAASAYGNGTITITPTPGPSSVDFNLFTPKTFKVVVAEIFTVTTASPRKPRPFATVVVGTSAPVTLDVSAALLGGTATFVYPGSTNLISFAGTNSSTFTMTKLAPGLVRYRLTPVGGPDLTRNGFPRFVPADFTIQVDPVELTLKLDQPTQNKLVQNRLTTVRANLDMASNVTFNFTSSSANLSLSKTSVSYSGVEDSAEFQARSAVFGPLTLTFVPSGADAGDFRPVIVFNYEVVGQVDSDLPGRVFTGDTTRVKFTISGGADVTFALASSGNVTATTLAWTRSDNGTTLDRLVSVLFGTSGDGFITLTPTGGLDRAAFAGINFTTSVVPNTNAACAVNQVTCPDLVSCRNTLADCPTNTSCPLDRPVRCASGLCALFPQDCSTPALQLPACPADKPTRCPDLSCAVNKPACPTGVTCPATMPVRCLDGTCRATLRDCPATPQCAPGFYACPSGDCVKGDRPEVCPVGPVCGQGQAMCPDLTCVASASLCATNPASVPAYCPPSAQQRCPDGSCISAGKTCPLTQCPLPGYPSTARTLCATGECIEGSVAQCPSTSKDTANGCPSSKPFKCTDGTCSPADRSACPSPAPVCPLSSTTSGTRLFQCKDGSCAATEALCPAATGCPLATPILCADLVNCVAEGGGCPLKNVCDPAAPYRCPDGLCVTSLSMCLQGRASPTCSDPANPVPCADGSCKPSSAACTTIKACPASRPARCSNGECRPTAAQCPLTTQRICTGENQYQCPLGECAATAADCRGANGCPASTPQKCASGACVAAGAACPAALANGCVAPTSSRCPNGECVAPGQEGSCKTADTGCSVSLPVRCGDGSCAANVATCNLRRTTCATGQVKCPDGACAASYGLCLALNGCPLTAPNRCANGQCKALLVSTQPAHVPDACTPDSLCLAPTPVKCADGSCVATSAECPAVPSCSPSKPVRCPGTLACVETLAKCPFFRCPIGAPVFCVDTGACVTKASLCSRPACPADTPYHCAWGECVKTLSECTKKVVCQGTGRSFACPDGSCRNAQSECPQIESCPSTMPFRCPSGACALSESTCPAVGRLSALQQAATAPGAACSASQVRCADGTCALPTQCPSSRGCSGRTPYLCPSGKCAANAAGCRGKCPLAGQFHCSDDTCQSVYTDCPAPPVGLISGVIVTHNPVVDASYDFLAGTFTEFRAALPAGSFATTEPLVALEIRRRSSADVEDMPWKPEQNLETAVFRMSAYVPGPGLSDPPSTQLALATSGTQYVAFVGGQRLVTAVTAADVQKWSVCISTLSDGLDQLGDCRAVRPFSPAGSSGMIATYVRGFGNYAAVNTTAGFGDLSNLNAGGNPLTSSPKKLTGGGIAGIVIAIIIFLLILLFAIILYLRRRKQKIAAANAANAEKVAMQAAEVEIAENDSAMLQSKFRGAPISEQAKQQAALTGALAAPLSVPVLAPKPKVRTLDVLPPLVSGKKPPQTVVPYRPALPTLFAGEKTTATASAAQADIRSSRNVDLATLARSAMEGLERSGAEDERPAMVSSLRTSTPSGDAPAGAPPPPGTASRKRLFDIRPRLGGGTLSSGGALNTSSRPQTNSTGGVEDEPPPAFSTPAPKVVASVRYGEIVEDEMERLPGGAQKIGTDVTPKKDSNTGAASSPSTKNVP